MKSKTKLFFEVSWEVCNKVGGIFTVLSSKAGQMCKHYDNYITIGPYFPEQARGNFEEDGVPEEYKEISERLSSEGINLHFGKWLIKGEPKVILVDFENFKVKINDIKKELWDSFKIDSLRTGIDYDEPVVWAYAVGMFLKEAAKENTVAQFHEWLCAPALLYLKKNNVDIATVFTTHATVMGRTLASNNVDLYKCNEEGKCALELMDIDKEAYNYSAEAKHLLEKQGANNSDIFTTVSEITGMEAEYVLKRKPDVILPNGLDLDKFPTFEEASIKHRLYRDYIKEFCLSYFFPYYTFDIKNTLIFFLAGRYEFKDKGIDIYIKALARLNNKLKKEKKKKTVIAFIWVPTGVKNVKENLRSNRTNFEDIKDSLDEEMNHIRRQILYDLMSGKKLSPENIFDSEFLFEEKKKVMKFKVHGNPELVTHDLQQYEDIITNEMYATGLDNKEDDPVKTIFYPIYLSGADGLLDLNYYECIMGSHLGVFPSFYEPWGYTPLETGALGVSSVTTDLAGFGRYLMKEKADPNKPGIFVLKRMGKSDDEITKDLSDFMFKFINFSKHERVNNKIEAKKLAEKADWKNLIKNYIKAHNLALGKRGANK